MKRGVDLACLALGAALLAYTCTRAALLSFTHDEALTWLHHVRAPLRQILAFDGFLPTNNHLLNTLLAKLTSMLFGPSELALRLPNLCAHAAYLYFSWRLVRRFAAPVTALAAFVLLNTQPFVLDFFSLCRGYGLSLGFLMAGLDSLTGERRETRGFALLALGVLSAFSLSNAFAGAGLLWLWRRPKQWRGPALVTAALGACLLPALWKLRPHLDFGGVVGLWHDTFGSLLPCIVYNQPAHPALLAVAAGGLMAGLWLKESAPPSPAPPLALVLVGSILFEEAAHLALATRFLTDRMAVFYLPLAGLALCFGLWRWPRPQRALACGVAALSLGHLVQSLDLGSTYLWAYDRDGRRLMADLPPGRLRLGCTWIFSPSLEYYRESRGLKWAPIVRGSPFGDYDFVFVSPEDRAEAERRGLALVREYRPSGNCLYRR